MKHPIKFRFWNKRKSGWESTSLFEINSDGILFNLYGEDEDCIVEQSLNKNDKNGREIFEGDIVCVDSEDFRKNTFIVKFGTVQRTLDSGALVEINGFYFETYCPESVWHKFPRFSIVNNFKNCHDLDVTEIIENIHENSEFLERKSV